MRHRLARPQCETGGIATDSPHKHPATGARSAVSSSLDVMLTDAVIDRGPARRFLEPASAVKVGRGPGAPPEPDGAPRSAGSAPSSAASPPGARSMQPARGDRRFGDRGVAGELVPTRPAAGLPRHRRGGRRPDLRRRPGLAQRAPGALRRRNVLDALAPTNFPWSNPAVHQGDRRPAAAPTWSRGAPALRRATSRAPPCPTVDTSKFEVGENLAVTPGLGRAAHRGLRADPVPAADRAGPRGAAAVRPADDQQVLRARPRAGPQPGRVPRRAGPAGVHDLLAQPGRRAGPLRPRHLRRARCSRRATRSPQIAAAAGGPPQRGLLGRHHQRRRARAPRRRRPARRDREPDAVGVRARQRARGHRAAFTNREIAAAAVAESAPQGYLDGQALAGVFAWLRPNDLVWNYVVNNYLMGKEPPAFDILYWNQDTVRLAAGLHRDFIRLALDNSLTHPGALTVLGSPVDLGAVDLDTLRRRRVNDHIVPWENAYRSAQLLGGDQRFVLSTQRAHPGAGQPAGPDSRSSYRVADEPRRRPTAWRAQAPNAKGSWWPDYGAVAAARSGELQPAPKTLGSRTHKARGEGAGHLCPRRLSGRDRVPRAERRGGADRLRGDALDGRAARLRRRPGVPRRRGPARRRPPGRARCRASAAATRRSRSLAPWLRRIGYRPRMCGFVANTGCSDRALERVERRGAALRRGERAARRARRPQPRRPLRARPRPRGGRDLVSHAISVGADLRRQVRRPAAPPSTSSPSPAGACRPPTGPALRGA